MEYRYVSADDFFMMEAKKACQELSNDHSISTGSVVVKDGKVIGRAGNRAVLTNSILIRWHKNGWCVRRLLRIPSGQKYWLCPGCAKTKNHSEQLAIRSTVKNGFEVEGADLYLWGHRWCCEPCQKAIRL